MDNLSFLFHPACHYCQNTTGAFQGANKKHLEIAKKYNDTVNKQPFFEESLYWKNSLPKISFPCFSKTLQTLIEKIVHFIQTKFTNVIKKEQERIKNLENIQAELKTLNNQLNDSLTECTKAVEIEEITDPEKQKKLKEIKKLEIEIDEEEKIIQKKEENLQKMIQQTPERVDSNLANIDALHQEIEDLKEKNKTVEAPSEKVEEKPDIKTIEVKEEKKELETPILKFSNSLPQENGKLDPCYQPIVNFMKGIDKAVGLKELEIKPFGMKTIYTFKLNKSETISFANQEMKNHFKSPLAKFINTVDFSFSGDTITMTHDGNKIFFGENQCKFDIKGSFLALKQNTNLDLSHVFLERKYGIDPDQKEKGEQYLLAIDIQTENKLIKFLKSKIKMFRFYKMSDLILNTMLEREISTDQKKLKKKGSKNKVTT